MSPRNRDRVRRAAVALLLAFAALLAWQPDAVSKPATGRVLPAMATGSAQELPAGTVPFGSHAFPSEPSAAPEPEAWEKATLLGNVKLGEKESCVGAVLGDWVRLRCESHRASGDAADMLAAVWAVAGDVRSVDVDTFAVPAAALEDLMKEGRPFYASGASAFDITFQLKRGSATLLEIVRARWSYESYNGNFFQSIDPGILIDASWALGEKTPTLHVITSVPI